MSLFNDTDILRGARFSDDRTRRYSLWRIWDELKPAIMFIGLNPSTANENEDDPTIRRVIGFAKKWGYGGVYMMNCYPLVSTDPRALDYYKTSSYQQDYSANIIHLKHTANKCGDIIFAWGNFKEAVAIGRTLATLFPNAKALEINKNGSPKHPLYVRGDIVPVPYKQQP